MRKVPAGLTKNGKRRGRRPKYLTEEQIADPLRLVDFPLHSGGYPQGRHERILRRLIERVIDEVGMCTGYELAYQMLLKLNPGSKPTSGEIEAMSARVRRLDV